VLTHCWPWKISYYPKNQNPLPSNPISIILPSTNSAPALSRKSTSWKDIFVILTLCPILNKLIDTALLNTIVICLKTTLSSSMYWLLCLPHVNFSRYSYFPTTVLYKPFLSSIKTTCSTHHYTVLLKIIVGVLTTCHTQYTWDSSM